MSRNSFEARRLVITILLKTKAWYLQNQKIPKHPNKTVNTRAFVIIAIKWSFSIRTSSTEIAIPPSPKNYGKEL